MAEKQDVFIFNLKPKGFLRLFYYRSWNSFVLDIQQHYYFNGTSSIFTSGQIHFPLGY